MVDAAVAAVSMLECRPDRAACLGLRWQRPGGWFRIVVRDRPKLQQQKDK